MLRNRRAHLDLSLRETARRTGISASYLVELEHGRNPSTGRAPMPSPPVLAAIGAVLDVDLATLLAATGVPPQRSAHALLFQVGAARRSARAGARRAVAGRVGAWFEIAAREPREAAAHLAALAADAGGDGVIGLIFGSGGLQPVDDPHALIASELTWERDVASACVAEIGAAPIANVCVYREADIRGLAGIDPLAAAIDLIRAHPHVAVQPARGAVTSGAAAIETILSTFRPAGIPGDAWTALAAAAAVGLQREAAIPRPAA